MRKTKSKSEAKGQRRGVVSIKGPAEFIDIAADEGLQRELKLANNRLNAKGRARWLLEFAYLDLSTLSQGARADLSYEVYAFGLADLSSNTNFIRNALVHFAMHEPHGLDKLVEEFQSAVREKFDQARGGGAWVFTYPSVEKHLPLFKQIKIPVTGFPSQPSESLGVNQLLRVATDLVEKEQAKFGICQSPRCQRPFVAERKGRVKFCSAKCSAYVRVTEKLKRDREAQKEVRQ